MPNIEVHGTTGQAEAWVNNIAGLIFSIFLDKPYLDEMVVTLCPTTVVDRNGKNQPFLRLVNSCQEHTKEILKKLQTLGMDVEHLQLEAFYPKFACEVDGCGGELDFSTRVPLTGTAKDDVAFACKLCRRVYREDGSQVLSHSTHEVFFRDGEFVKGSAAKE